MKTAFNILIAGVGGQGVAGLTHVLWNACEKQGRPCRGTIFKGGAQTLGSVHSIIRIFPEPGAHRLYSHSLLPGDVDLLIGLEPFEALRHIRLCRSDTVGAVSTQRVPFWSERHQPLGLGDPAALLRERCPELLLRDCTGRSGHELLLEILAQAWLPLDAEQLRRDLQNQS